MAEASQPYSIFEVICASWQDEDASTPLASKEHSREICEVFRSLMVNKNEQKAPVILLSGPGPSNLEAGCFPSLMGPLLPVCLPSICSDKDGPQQSASFVKPLHCTSGPSVATNGVIPRSSKPASGRTTPNMKLTSSTPSSGGFTRTWTY